MTTFLSGARLVAPVLLLVTSAGAQLPDTTHLSKHRADLLTGLYQFPDGERFHIADLRDQLNGRQTLSVVEFSSGRLRGLYPDSGQTFRAGSAWFSRSPASYTVEFESTSAPARPLSLRWTEDGATRTAVRVPMTERAAVVVNGDITLTGTLTLPPGPGPHPAMVMVPGSGPLTRRMARYVGDLVTAYGVAVLTMDKRGTGGSNGNWNGLSHAAWATDVHAQLNWLRAQPGIDTARIGLMGGSEGGYVAPVVAAERSDVGFLVCRVCPALPHPEVIVDMESAAMRSRGWSEDEVGMASELLARMMRFALDGSGYDSLVSFANAGVDARWRSAVPLVNIPAAAAPYWERYRGLLVVDPREVYGRLNIPTLVILGERDDRILVDKHRSAFEQAGARRNNFFTWVIPDASHGLLLDPEGVARYPAAFHDRLAGWIAEAAGVGRRPASPNR